MRQRLLSFLLLLSSISAQSFFYSYIDPCEQTTVRTSTILQNGIQGFQVTYYNRTKFFTLEQVISGELEQWTQDVYRDFENLFPCAVRVAEEVLSSVIAIMLQNNSVKVISVMTQPKSTMQSVLHKVLIDG